MFAGRDRCCFYNPGLLQSHNSFVFLGCVQFVNPCCGRAIKMARRRPCQHEAETGVESQLQQWLAVVLGQFASLVLRSNFLIWKTGRIQAWLASGWLNASICKCLSHSSWKLFPLSVLKVSTSRIFPFCLKDQYDIWCFTKFKYIVWCCSTVTVQK